MDGQSVHAGFEGGDGFWQEVKSIVKGNEARKFCRQHPIEINLRVFIVMNLEFDSARVLLSERELPPKEFPAFQTPPRPLATLKDRSRQ